MRLLSLVAATMLLASGSLAAEKLISTGDAFTKDGKTLTEWLAQFPEDQRCKAISHLLNDSGADH